MKKTTKKLATNKVLSDSCTENLPDIAKKECSWCVFFGFKKDDHDEVGYLGFRSPNELRANPKAGLYKIVDDISEAKWFPCENCEDTVGFAVPEKWLEFFNSDPSLEEWKFHLVKRSKKASG